MKLNLSIVQDELKGIESFLFRHTGFSLIFDCFETYAEQEISPECLYLMDAEKVTPEMVLRDDLSLLCFGTISNRVLQYRRCNILMLPQERLTGKWLNRVGQIFSKYNRWSENLLMLAMDNDAIRQIFTTDILDEVFGNPILMQTANGLFGISHGELPENFDSKRWTDIVSQGREFLDSEGVSYDELALQESFRDPFVFEQTKNYTLMAINAFSGDSFQGRLIHCDSVREFTDGYLSLAIYLNDIFAGIVERNVEDEIVGQGDCNVFIELLGDWHTESAWLENQLELLSWEKDLPRRLIVIPAKSQKGSSALASMIGENLRVLFPEEYVFPYKGDYLVITRSEDDVQGLLTKIETVTGLVGVSAAVSLPFFDISRLRSVYRQCRYLLEAGISRGGGFYSPIRRRDLSPCNDKLWNRSRLQVVAASAGSTA